MDFREYQDRAYQTAIYPREYNVIYPALGLASEAGEVAGKIKKILRDGKSIRAGLTPEKRLEIGAELGDCLWYIAVLCMDLDLDLDTFAVKNLEKLKDRQERGVLGGSGDNR